MLKSAVLVSLLAVAAPAHATNWTYVDSSNELTNISFVDKDGITTNAEGVTSATLYTVLWEYEDNVAAYRFKLEVRCASGESRMIASEVFDTKLVPSGFEPAEEAWEPVDPGTQGQVITNFICTKGAQSKGPSFGGTLPYDKGRKMLADRRAGKVTK